MAKLLTWKDTDEIGVVLSQAHPEIEPSSVRFPDLHRLVTELEEFHDDPGEPDEAKLRAIQEAWQAEFLDRTQG